MGEQRSVLPRIIFGSGYQGAHLCGPSWCIENRGRTGRIKRMELLSRLRIRGLAQYSSFLYAYGLINGFSTSNSKVKAIVHNRRVLLKALKHRNCSISHREELLKYSASDIWK